jgi:glycosyltransferase involved in cell wall biosynthesis
VNAAILFEPDGYVLTGPRLMGRQAAGNGFLRAAVKAGGPLSAYTPSKASGEAFRALAQEIDPAVKTGWLPASRLELLGDFGVLYRPDHSIGLSARARLRVGVDHYSICGVTHTLASAGAMDIITDYAVAPIAPWDAVICTSTVAVEVIETALAAQDEYLAWRFGQASPAPRPQLPVIPLGVHCADFETSGEGRAEARATLDLADDEVVALFAGRLSFNGKAHPYAMYAALQEVTRKTGRRVTLIQAGRFFNKPIEGAFRSAVAQFCPDVRAIFVDGGGELYGKSWRAADLFISLSDNIQETFGLTPVEAMAAGLPVLVTDWNGYKDTVRDGVDGFRIPTWAPEPGSGERLGRDYEVELTNYDHFLSRASTAVALDMRLLVERLAELVTNPELRRRLGEAGRARARALFDWSVIYPQYQALWTELNALRLRTRDDPRQAAWLATAPKAAPGRLDPFTAFARYPSGWITSETRVRRTPGGTVERYEWLVSHPMWGAWNPTTAAVAQLLDALGDEDRSVAQLAPPMATTPQALIELVARLAKMDLLQVRA